MQLVEKKLKGSGQTKKHFEELDVVYTTYYVVQTGFQARECVHFVAQSSSRPAPFKALFSLDPADSLQLHCFLGLGVHIVLFFFILLSSRPTM